MSNRDYFRASQKPPPEPLAPFGGQAARWWRGQGRQSASVPRRPPARVWQSNVEAQAPERPLESFAPHAATIHGILTSLTYLLNVRKIYIIF